MRWSLGERRLEEPLRLLLLRQCLEAVHGSRVRA
jgi:hypothetical protein